MYGVVVCPRCKRAKGVDLKQKTTTCLCGFEIRVVPSRVRARANTARELAPLVGQVSAEIAGGLKAYREAAAPVRRIRPRDVHLRVIGVVSKAQGRANRVRAAAGGEPRRSRRRDRGKRLVDAEDEGEEERGMSEPDGDRPEKGRPHLLAGGSETDEGTGVRVHQAEADRQDQEQAQGLRDVERVAR